MKKTTLLFFVITLNLFSQTVPKVDSLFNALKSAKADTSKIAIWNSIADEFMYSKPDSAVYYANKAHDLSLKIKYVYGELKANVAIGATSYITGNSKEGIKILLSSKVRVDELLKKEPTNKHRKLLAALHNNLGNNYFTIGDIDSAYIEYKKTLEVYKSFDYKKGIATTILNISNIETMKGDVGSAIKNLLQALKIAESINDKKTIAFCYNNMAKIYAEQNEREKAIDYLKKALVVAEEIDFLNISSVGNINLASQLIEKGKAYLPEALMHAEKGLKQCKEIKNNARISSALQILARVYLAQKNIKLAISSLNEALEIVEKTDDKISIANCNLQLANAFIESKDYNTSTMYGEKALRIARELNSPILIFSCSTTLAQLYKEKGDYKQAFAMKELAVQMNDSVINQNNQKEIMSQEFKYDYDKKTLADSLNYLNEKKILAIANQAELKEEKNKQIALFVFLGLAILVGAFIFNRFKVTQKQKVLIETQSQRLEMAHHQLEIKSKEIKDSILYSKEIQNVFLKPLSENSAYFNDSLLIYKPKDVVSGDFYWYKELNENLFIVIGDCTGHGVPGAIISVLAIQTLERLINQVKDIGKLHELNVLMNNEFKIYNSQNDLVNIGLDFSVMCLNKQTKKIYLSGSGSSMLIKNKQNELIQEKFDSINIGGDMPFQYEPETKTYNIEDLHAVFLYTDGIVDQRGGEERKRFSTPQLKELIANLNTNDSHVAYQKIENTIKAWQGDNVQMDDMTFFAIQFNNII